VWLGILALRARREKPAQVTPGNAPLWPIFRDGFLVALLNPKTAIFFAAFLPQFMTPAGSPALQGMALGALFVGIAAITDSAYALAASAVAPRLTRSHGLGTASRLLTGGAFIGLGVFTALSGNRGGN